MEQVEDAYNYLLNDEPPPPNPEEGPPGATPWWFSSGDVGVGVSRYERGAEAEAIEAYGHPGQENYPLEPLRDRMLSDESYWGWSPEQQEYLGDVPVSWEQNPAFSGAYYPDNGQITVNPDYYELGRVMQHELLHAWQRNAQSPREIVEWLDKYNLAVMEGRMKPIGERSYFPDNPNARATEAYAEVPLDLPYDMWRFYQPPTTPASTWQPPAWRRREEPAPNPWNYNQEFGYSRAR